MADIIHLLPDTVANQIAAGEVIQRPASVIKELTENAVDAGATRIDVLVVDAGKTSIQVVDDGKGMSETDARLAFERHATSKIREAADLFALSTMGFRGEALPSIAAVSQVTLRTRLADAELGTCLIIEGGRVVSQETDACQQGCNFLVQNLFFNVPARRRFLKSNQTELSNIIQEFERVALVNPDIHFTFSHNGQLQNNYQPASLRQRIADVFGHKFGDALLGIDVETSLCNITGFVGRPDSARKKGAHQYFFVNGRYMRHPYFQKAVQNSFEGLIPPTEQVPFFLYLQTDPSTIDVNIHPTKTEIKFENEQAIWQIITAAVRETLGRFNAVPIIEFDREGTPDDIPVYSPSHQATRTMPQTRVNSSYNPFDGGTVQANRIPTNWEALYEDLKLSPETKHPSLPIGETMEGETVERSSRHYQYRGQYILTETRDGLMIVDQHRAHLRILYNRYRKQLAQGNATTQRLLFPALVKFSSSDASLFEEIQDELTAVGFDLSPLGDGSFSVLGLPSNLDAADPQNLFDEILNDLREGGQSVEEKLQSRLALIMARGASIAVGQELSQEEMETLVAELFNTGDVTHAPDGSKIAVFLEQKSIENLFN